jgi:hypothetical protein
MHEIRPEGFRLRPPSVRARVTILAAGSPSSPAAATLPAICVVDGEAMVPCCQPGSREPVWST